MAALVLAYRAYNRRLQLESREVWLWVPAFVVMGVGCLANAARCGRTHCYVTGPLFLLAAVYVALSAFGIVALHPNLFLLVVFGACCLAMFAEIPLGKYRSRT